MDRWMSGCVSNWLFSSKAGWGAPKRVAVSEWVILALVLRPGGLLSLSTSDRLFWRPRSSLRWASFWRLRAREMSRLPATATLIPMTVWRVRWGRTIPGSSTGTQDMEDMCEDRLRAEMSRLVYDESPIMEGLSHTCSSICIRVQSSTRYNHTVMRAQHTAHSFPAFPVYSCAFIADDQVLVGAGGGASRTGIKNKLVCRPCARIVHSPTLD